MYADQVIILGGASATGRAISASLTAVGASPIVIDVEEPPSTLEVVNADLDPADLAAELPMPPAGRTRTLVVCASIEASRPGFLRRCLEKLLGPSDTKTLVLGVAAATGTSEHQEPRFRADAEVVRSIHHLEVARPDVVSGLVLHGPLAPVFEDCRGELQEMDDPACLLAKDVADAVEFVLSRAGNLIVRHLHLDALPSRAAAPDAAYPSVAHAGAGS